MAITQRLEFRQSQSLVMTPQLQQAIKLLQLSNVELVDYVDQELEKNPLLEPDEGAEPEPADTVEPGAAPPLADEPGDGEGEATPDTLDLANAETLPSSAETPLDVDYETDFDSDGPTEAWTTGGASFEARDGGFDDRDFALDQRLSDEPTLRQHLAKQLQMDVSDPVDRMIGIHLIDMLDDAGYLAGDLPTLADLLGCDVTRVEAALTRMQLFDPPGIFARDLRESLALQLADLNRLDPAMEALLDNLDLLAAGDAAKLKRLCGVDDEDLSDMIAEIKALNPKPALTFDIRVAEPVVPDILMRRQPDGAWTLELNSQTLPRVLVNNQYYARISKDARSKADRDYIVERFQSANWLVKALHQRATTILKVATEIVRRQDAFFRKGVQHLRPLTLRDIAEAIGMHESTISRATSNKYMATPRGTHELKYFFTSAIAGTDNGAAHSAEAVRHRIKQLIAAESPEDILSDDTIVKLLRKDEIDIARRTVAKYREGLRIPSSVRRRRQKAQGL